MREGVLNRRAPRLLWVRARARQVDESKAEFALLQQRDGMLVPVFVTVRVRVRMRAVLEG